jgi:hypothetical protein
MKYRGIIISMLFLAYWRSGGRLNKVLIEIYIFVSDSKNTAYFIVTYLQNSLYGLKTILAFPVSP